MTTHAFAQPKYKKKMWTQEEDDMLVQLVNEHGTNNWVIISQHMENRTGKQCRERWLNRHNPGIKNTQWTEEEDKLIIDKQKEYGNSWVKIAQFIPGRSSDSIKTRFSWLKHKSANKQLQMKYTLPPTVQDFHQTSPNQLQMQSPQNLDPSFLMQSPQQLSPLMPSPQMYLPFQTSPPIDSFEQLQTTLPPPLIPQISIQQQQIPVPQNIIEAQCTPQSPPQITQQTIQKPPETSQTKLPSMFQNIIVQEPEKIKPVTETNEPKKEDSPCNIPSIHVACYQPTSIFNKTIFNQTLPNEQRETDEPTLFSSNDSVFEKRPSNCFWKRI